MNLDNIISDWAKVRKSVAEALNKFEKQEAKEER